MVIRSLTDVLPIDQGIAICALGPVGLGMVACVVVLIATWGYLSVRGRSWLAGVAVACGVLATLCVIFLWLSARASADRRQRRFLERESARQQAALTVDAGRRDGP